MVLNRDSIRNGIVQEIAEEGERLGLIRRLSLEERIASREKTLAARPPGVNDVWVFGYGSLMWNPAFHHVDRLRGRIYGYHRAFCLKTFIGRGSPDKPGLVLGLDYGGSCQGIAFRVDPGNLEEELDVVWSREMVADGYCPTWVTMHTERGPVPAITFVMNRTYERYVKGLPQETIARMIAEAEGRIGRCAEYLENTVQSLDELGIADGPMHRLLVQVRELEHIGND